MSRNDQPCHYCDGEGYGEKQVDVDDWERVFCEYCDGSGYYSRPAGMRDTSAPKHDPLRDIRQYRIGYVKAKRRYAAAVERQDELGPAEMLKADQNFSISVWYYHSARRRAVMPVSSLARCDMLARATICADMASQLR